MVEEAPVDLTATNAALASIAETLRTMPEAWADTLEAYRTAAWDPLRAELQEIYRPLYVQETGLATALTDALAHQTAATQTAGEDVRYELAEIGRAISENLFAVQHCLCAMSGSTAGTVNFAVEKLTQVLEKIATAGVDHLPDVLDHLAQIGRELAPGIGEAITGWIDRYVAGTPGKGEDRPTLGGGMAQAQMDLVDAMTKHGSPSWMADTIDGLGWIFLGKLTRWLPCELGAVAANKVTDGLTKEAWDGVLAYLKQWAEETMEDLKATGAAGAAGDPAALWTRALSTYGTAAALGIGSHVLSGVLSGSVLGVGGLRFAGVAAIIAKLAGFDDIVNSITGNFYRSWLQMPMRYYFQDMLRPTIPGAMDVCRLRWKSRVSTKMDMVKDLDGFKKVMALHGFTDEWIVALEDDLYAEPGHFELGILGQSQDAWTDPAWWTDKVLRAGYTDRDGQYMVDGMEQKIGGSYIAGYTAQLISRVGMGMMTVDDLKTELELCKMAPVVVEYAAKMGEERWINEDLNNAVYELRQQYARDEIDAKTLSTSLDGIGMRPEKVARIVEIDRLKRTHRVWLLTPTEEARKLVSLYRQTYRTGIVSRGEYSGQLSAAGLAADVIKLQLALDDEARDRTVASHLRSWHLPTARDAVIAGKITPAEYAARLKSEGFPAGLLAAEAAYVKALAERAQKRRVERYQIPPAERAYVLGLAAAATLTRLWEEAGYTAAQTVHRKRIL